MARHVPLPLITSLLLGALPVSADQPLSHDAGAYNSLCVGPAPNQTYHSANITGPLFLANTFDPTLVQGPEYVFLAGSYGGKSGPMIFSSGDLSLVYADLRYETTYDVRVQSVPGNVYLTYVADGSCHVLDKTYGEQFTIRAKGRGETAGYMRECLLTDNGTAVVSLSEEVPFNLEPVGGSANGQLLDSVLQEVELSTGELVFEWRASEHFDLADTYAEPVEGDKSNAFDWFHLSSVSKNRDGDYLVSARNLCLVALIDHQSGNASWILGGKKNGFQDLSQGNAVNFGYQNDARYVLGNESRIALFDNHGTATGPCQPPHCSRAMQIELDYKQRTVRLMEERFHPHGVASGTGGSAQRLPNLNLLVSWGSNPTMTEYLQNGTMVMDVQQGPIAKPGRSSPGVDTGISPVRKMSWMGLPSVRPRIACLVGVSAKNRTVYLSWNGATQIDTWQVFAGLDVSNITNVNTPVGHSQRSGFETAVVLQSGGQIPPFARAAVVDGHGNVLAATDVIDLETGKLTVVSNPIDIVPMASLDGDDTAQGGQGAEIGKQTAAAAAQNASAGQAPGSVSDEEKHDSAGGLELSLSCILSCLALEILCTT